LSGQLHDETDAAHGARLARPAGNHKREGLQPGHYKVVGNTDFEVKAVMK
jgi:hypothetical protein